METGDRDFYFIPSHLDDQAKILIWDMDEAMGILGGLSVGIIVKQLIIFVLIGFFLSYVIAKTKAARGRGFLAAICYWHLPHNSLFRFKRYPASYIRDIVG